MSQTLNLSVIKHYIGFACQYPTKYNADRIPMEYAKGTIIGIDLDENLVAVRHSSGETDKVDGISPLEIILEGKSFDQLTHSICKDIISSVRHRGTNLDGAKYRFKKGELGHHYTFTCNEDNLMQPDVTISHGFRVIIHQDDGKWREDAQPDNPFEVICKILELGFLLH